MPRSFWKNRVNEKQHLQRFSRLQLSIPAPDQVTLLLMGDSLIYKNAEQQQIWK